MPFVAALSREKLLITARTLPAAPQVLAELGELLQDVNMSLDQIADLLKRDAALAARIIRISNSSVFGVGARIGAIEEAVNRVGFGEVYRLVGLATTSRLADRALSYYGVEADPLREHMLFTALAAEALAKDAGMDPRLAYTAGLLRPLGMLVLDRVGRERLPASESYNPAIYAGFAEWEGQVFSLSNCEVGAMILTEWKFPPEIVAAVREHYLRRKADLDNRFAILLNLAGWMGAANGCGLAGEGKYFELTEEKRAPFHLEEEQIKIIASGVVEEFQRQREHLM